MRVEERTHLPNDSCEKCLSGRFSEKYQPPHRHYETGEILVSDRLRRTCGNCGYVWRVDTANPETA